MKFINNEARKLVLEQATRYHMDEPRDPVNNPPMSQLLLNTITNYFVTFGGSSFEEELEKINSGSKNKKDKENKIGHYVDLYI